MSVPGWAREPLVHFLILGAAIYALLMSLNPGVDPSSRMIRVDEEQAAQLALGFERVMGRAPTDAELDARIDQWVREEVLFREGLRLGLDQGDAVVRQRIISKMDMSASAAAEAAEPSEELLRDYFEANIDQYAGDVRLTFDQLYFREEAQARAALIQGNGESRADPISLPARLDDAARGELEARFGAVFTSAISALDESESWQGPIRSGFGWHIVRIEQKREQSAQFEMYRERVENDWRSAEISRRKDEAYRVLSDAYTIEIDR